MNKTIEFIEKEIKNMKELLELDKILCLSPDDHYKSWYDSLKMFQQVKAELEAWKLVADKIFYGVGKCLIDSSVWSGEEAETIRILGFNYFPKYWLLKDYQKTWWLVSDKKEKPNDN